MVFHRKNRNNHIVYTCKTRAKLQTFALSALIFFYSPAYLSILSLFSVNINRQTRTNWP